MATLVNNNSERDLSQVRYYPTVHLPHLLPHERLLHLHIKMGSRGCLLGKERHLKYLRYLSICHQHLV